MTSGGLAAVSSSFFAALCCAFGKYDVVHIHAEGPAFFAWLPKMFGKKVIVTIHGLDWQREKWKSGFGSKFIHQGEKNAVKYADEIIVLSKGVQDYFEKTYGRKTVFIDEQVEILKPEQLTKKLTLIKTYNYGAATVINKSAKELVCRVWPEVDDLPHDMWIGTLCFWFGKVYYVDEELYYWIRYDTSVTGEGTKETAIQYRLKKTLQKKSYPNISTAMLEFYSDILKPSDQAFLKKVSDYKNVFKDKMSLLFDPSFKRLTVAGTVALKLGILLNWY